MYYEPQPGTQRAVIWARAETVRRMIGTCPALIEVFDDNGISTVRTATAYFYEWVRLNGLHHEMLARTRQFRAAGLRVLPKVVAGSTLASALGRKGRRTRAEFLADLAEADRTRAAEGLPPIETKSRPRAVEDVPPPHLPGAGIWRLLEENRT